MQNKELKEILNKALELESKRRSPPFDLNGNSLNFNSAHEEYCAFLYKNGYLIITNLLERIK